MPNFLKRGLSSLAIAGISMLAFAFPAMAADKGTPPGDFKVQAWAHEHKGAIDLFLGINVDQCKGLDGLTYEQAVDLAKAQHVDLNKLIDQADPGAMLKYVENSGITYAQLKAMLESFCNTPPKHPTTHPTHPSHPSTPAGNGNGNSGSHGKSGSAPHGKANGHDKEDLAHTGSEVNPWALGGGAAAFIGAGTGLTVLVRRKGLLK